MAQDRYALLEQPCQISRSAWPMIQRMAHYLRIREGFAKYSSPKMVSFGPIHHGEPHLQLGEQYKLMWASRYVKGNRNQSQRLHRKIIVNIKDLKDLYTLDALRHFNDDELAWMLFVDGCSLLQILKHPGILNPEPDVNFEKMALVRQDALLLENQLPFRVLQLLSDLPDRRLIKDMDYYLFCRHFWAQKDGAEKGDQPQIEIDVDPNPVHLLDEMRKILLRDFFLRVNQKLIRRDQITYRNLKELKEAGIQVKKGKSSYGPIDITFSSRWLSGELNIPAALPVDDTFASVYLNLIAYEACPYFDHRYEISSFFEFLASMIENQDDVKELRSCGSIINGLGSDEEIVKFFKFITPDLVPNSTVYDKIKDDIERYFCSKYRRWLLQAYHAYFSNSGSFIAFLAASVALILTFLQTWFTIRCST